MCSDSKDKVTDSLLSFSVQIILSSLLTSLFGELSSTYFLLPSPKKAIACMLSQFSFIRLFATPWTVARQAPLSVGFSQQEYWSGVAISFWRRSFRPRDHTQVSCLGRWILNYWAPWEAQYPIINPNEKGYLKKKERVSVCVYISESLCWTVDINTL